MALLSLPHELLASIVEYLSPEETFKLAMTYRTIYTHCAPRLHEAKTLTAEYRITTIGSAFCAIKLLDEIARRPRIASYMHILRHFQMHDDRPSLTPMTIAQKEQYKSVYDKFGPLLTSTIHYQYTECRESLCVVQFLLVALYPGFGKAILERLRMKGMVKISIRDFTTC